MELTDKCKVDFEKWYNKTYSRELVYSTMNETLIMTLPIPFVYGVYVDFFDSVNLPININSYGNGESWQYDITTMPIIYDALTRQEARTEAIKKANEIYNKN